jgi:hypothetical protein
VQDVLAVQRFYSEQQLDEPERDDLLVQPLVVLLQRLQQGGQLAR